PIDVTILTGIDGLRKNGHILAARDLLLDKTIYKPDVKAYNAVINGLCKNGTLDDALELKSRMIDKGISPTVVTWKEVKGLLNEMVNHKISLDVVTLNVLVDAFCKEGNVKEAREQEKMDKAKELFDSITGNGLKPSIISYGTLMNGYCKRGKVDEALRLFLEASSKGLEHTTALCKTHQIAEAFSFLRAMEDKGVSPNIITYGILINGLCKDGKLEDAKNILNELPSKGLQPNIKIYAVIIRALCEEGFVDEAKDVLIKMERSGCAPDSMTYNTIICCLLKKKEVYKALPLLEEIHKRGFSADASTLSMLISYLQEFEEDNNLMEIIKKVVPKI
ncbi:hypothetical protein MIMGU_mgv1a026647mg, partial [Erythranthe guttata]